jgi:hypothetical protein
LEELGLFALGRRAKGDDGIEKSVAYVSGLKQLVNVNVFRQAQTSSLRISSASA